MGRVYRSIWPVLGLIALIPSARAEALTESRAWINCKGGVGIWSDLRLSACNDLIKSGKASGADLAKLYYFRGNAFLTQSDYTAAIDDFDRSLNIAKDDPNALHERCWARGVMNVKLEDALADCNESLRLQPNDGETLGARGFVYTRLGFYRTAIRDYDAALSLSPNTAQYLYGRGSAKLKAGDNESGEADMSAARAIDPKIDVQFARYDEAAAGKGFWGAFADYVRAMMKWVY